MSQMKLKKVIVHHLCNHDQEHHLLDLDLEEMVESLKNSKCIDCMIKEDSNSL